MLPEGRYWIGRRTTETPGWTAGAFASAKDGTRISVVLPARDEQRTVGRIVTAIRTDLMDRVPLVDELVVDSRSTDATARFATAAGVRVVARTTCFPTPPRARRC
jgi:glucosyl-3-phosphoglycerate synthase